ncbi:carbohydrate kinase [Candidatus Sumerlaeota bacterium]|nr:carbohydrate kinase [Candidatus Sumerlaeota bacterium]
MAHRVAGLGEALWDVYPSGKVMGGAPANFAFYVHALGGGQAEVASCVGADALGRELLATLRDRGVGCRHVAIDCDHPTGVVNVEVDSAGKPEFHIREDVAWDYIPENPDLLALARECDAVCFGTLAQRSPMSRGAIRAFLGSMPSSSIRLYDVNLRQHFYSREIIDASLRLASVVKVSSDELPAMARSLGLEEDEERLFARLIPHYDLNLGVLTRGADGSTVYDADGVWHRPGHKVAVRDTVGAGDSFTAGFVVGLLQGIDARSAQDRASRLAGYVCTQEGAMAPVPKEIRALFL